MNEQQVEGQKHLENGLLDVHSIFSTIQGEGPFTGKRAIFVRLAGCNLQCPLCDTDYTSSRKVMTPDQIRIAVSSLINDPDREQGYLVVITGGEPFRQYIRPLVGELLGWDFRVQIETNGTLYQDLPFFDDVTVVCSPKAGKIHPKLLPHISAFKYVLHADQKNYNDGLPVRALNHPVKLQLARPPKNFTGAIYLQPVDEQNPEENARHLDSVIESVMKFGHTLQLQTHKIINME